MAAKTKEQLLLEILLDASQLKAEMDVVERKNETWSKKLQKNFEEALAPLRGMEKALGAVGLGMAAFAGGAVISRIVEVTRETMAWGKSIEMVGERLGITSTNLQELQFVASQSNLEMRTLEMGMQRFQRRAGEAAMGKGEALDTMKFLGIDPTNERGGMKDALALFEEAIDKIGQVDDAQQRLAHSFKLFDSEGVAITQMVDRYDELIDRAQKLNLVIGEDGIRVLKDSKDQLETWGKLFGSVRTRFMLPFLRDLNDIGDKLLNMVEQDPAIRGAALLQNVGGISRVADLTQLGAQRRIDEITQALINPSRAGSDMEAAIRGGSARHFMMDFPDIARGVGVNNIGMASSQMANIPEGRIATMMSQRLVDQRIALEGAMDSLPQQAGGLMGVGDPVNLPSGDAHFKAVADAAKKSQAEIEKMIIQLVAESVGPQGKQVKRIEFMLANFDAGELSEFLPRELDKLTEISKGLLPKPESEGKLVDRPRLVDFQDFQAREADRIRRGRERETQRVSGILDPIMMGQRGGQHRAISDIENLLSLGTDDQQRQFLPGLLKNLDKVSEEMAEAQKQWMHDLETQSMTSWEKIGDAAMDEMEDVFVRILSDSDLTWKKVAEGFQRIVARQIANDLSQIFRNPDKGIQGTTIGSFITGATGAFGAARDFFAKPATSVEQALQWAPWNDDIGLGPQEAFLSANSGKTPPPVSITIKNSSSMANASVTPGGGVDGRSIEVIVEDVAVRSMYSGKLNSAWEDVSGRQTKGLSNGSI